MSLSQETSVAVADTGVPGLADGQFVTFSSAGNHYGIDIMVVREIRSWQPATQLAGRSPVSRGVLDIRGQVVEVLDLSAALGGTPTSAGRGSVVLVIARGDRTLGLLVDAVSDIIQVESHDIMALPPSIETLNDRHLHGMVNHEERLIALLDVDQLL